jgi:hypothetical protein
MINSLDPDITPADCDKLSDEELVNTLLDRKVHIGTCCDAANAIHRNREEASKKYAGTEAEWIESAHQAGRDMRTAKAAVLARMKKDPS